MFKNMSIDLSQIQKQGPALSPSLQKMLKITQLSNIELFSYLQEQVLSNPFLEVLPPASLSNQRSETTASNTSVSSVIEATYSWEKPSSINEYLSQQLNLEYFFNSDLQEACQYLIKNIDESGFLRSNLSELTLPPDLAAQALTIIQTLDPPGVGARNLTECFLLQLPHHSDVPDGLASILTEFGDDLIKNRLPFIQRKTKYSLAELQNMLLFLKKLSPAPGKEISNEAVLPILPDLSLTIKNDFLQLDYMDANIPSLQIDTTSATDYLEQSKEIQSFVKKYIAHYSTLSRALQMRKRTLLLITHAIINHQKDYFLGNSPLRPLQLKDLSRICNLSISTVSRTISEKYIQINSNTCKLSSFLSRAFHNTESSNNEISISEIKGLLRSIISKENPTAPYSDLHLQKIMTRLGITISRRAITKYRQALGIPNSRYRKNYSIK